MGLMLIFTPIIWFMAVCVESFVATIGLGGVIGGVIFLSHINEFKKRNILPVITIIIGIVFIVIGIAFTASAVVAFVFTTYYCYESLVGMINY